MYSRKIKIKGQEYVLMSQIDEGVKQVFVNGVPAKNLYYNSEFNVHFAPFSFPEGNFWFTVYKKQPRLMKTQGELTEKAFIEEYAKPAYNSLFMVLYTIFCLLVPNMILIFLHIWKGNFGSPYSYVFWAALETIFLWVINPAPICSRKSRRLIGLWTLVLLGVEVFLFILSA